MSNLIRYRLWPGDSINMPKFIASPKGQWVKFDDIKEFLKPTSNTAITKLLDELDILIDTIGIEMEMGNKRGHSIIKQLRALH